MITPFLIKMLLMFWWVMILNSLNNSSESQLEKSPNALYLGWKFEQCMIVTDLFANGSSLIQSQHRKPSAPKSKSILHPLWSLSFSSGSYIRFFTNLSSQWFILKHSLASKYMFDVTNWNNSLFILKISAKVLEYVPKIEVKLLVLNANFKSCIAVKGWVSIYD